MAKISGENSACLYGNAATINDANGTTTITVDFASAHGFVASDRINISGVVGMTDLNGNHRVLTVPDSDTLTVLIDTTEQTYTSDGTAQKNQLITSANISQTAEVQNVTDSGSAGVNEYIPNGYTDWTLDLEGWLEDNINTIPVGTALTLRLNLDTGNEYFTGTASITSKPVALTVNGTDAVKVSYTAQGTGTLTEPT